MHRAGSFEERRTHRTDAIKELKMSKEKSASQQIDDIIKEPGDWRGEKLSQLRDLIRKANSAIIEEVKWKMPSKSLGSPVWSHDGILCVADTLKTP